MILPLLTTLTNKNTVQFAANLIVKRKSTIESIKNATATTTETGVIETETGAVVKETVAKTAEAVATKGAAGANLTFAQSLKLVLGALWPILLAVGAVIAIYSVWDNA